MVWLRDYTCHRKGSSQECFFTHSFSLTIHSDFTTVTYEQAIIFSVAGSTFLHLLEELRRVGESFTGSLVLFSVPDPLQTYRWLALLKLLYFFEGEETLVLKH